MTWDPKNVPILGTPGGGHGDETGLRPFRRIAILGEGCNHSLGIHKKSAPVHFRMHGHLEELAKVAHIVALQLCENAGLSQTAITCRWTTQTHFPFSHFQSGQKMIQVLLGQLAFLLPSLFLFFRLPLHCLFRPRMF